MAMDIDNVCAGCGKDGLSRGEVESLYLARWHPERKSNQITAVFCDEGCLLLWVLNDCLENMTKKHGDNWIDAKVLLAKAKRDGTGAYYFGDRDGEGG